MKIDENDIIEKLIPWPKRVIEQAEIETQPCISPEALAELDRIEKIIDE